MSSIQKRKIAPFLSIFIIVLVGLAVIFVKMEAVREGYELFRLGRFHKIANDEKARLDVSYAKLTRPERLDQIGTKRLSLNRTKKNQMVLMAATGGFAVRQ